MFKRNRLSLFTVFLIAFAIAGSIPPEFVQAGSICDSARISPTSGQVDDIVTIQLQGTTTKANCSVYFLSLARLQGTTTKIIDINTRVQVPINLAEQWIEAPVTDAGGGILKVKVPAMRDDPYGKVFILPSLEGISQKPANTSIGGIPFAVKPAIPHISMQSILPGYLPGSNFVINQDLKKGEPWVAVFEYKNSGGPTGSYEIELPPPSGTKTDSVSVSKATSLEIPAINPSKMIRPEMYPMQVTVPDIYKGIAKTYEVQNFYVKRGSVASNPLPIKILSPNFALITLDKTTAYPGNVVTVTGENLNAYPKNEYIAYFQAELNRAVVAIPVWDPSNPNKFTLTVPDIYPPNLSIAQVNAIRDFPKMVYLSRKERISGLPISIPPNAIWPVRGQPAPLPFDPIWYRTDPNGLPLNPWWGSQVGSGRLPNSTPDCGDFEFNNPCSPGAYFKKKCTNVPITIDLPVDTKAATCILNRVEEFVSRDSLDKQPLKLTLGASYHSGFGPRNTFCNALPKFKYVFGHVNWFPVTYEGEVIWNGWTYDGDFNFEFFPKYEAGLTEMTTVSNNILIPKKQEGIELEFDSEETAKGFTSPWWGVFYNNVKADEQDILEKSGEILNLDEKDVAAGRAALGQTGEPLIRTKAIVTGLLGLDCDHGCKSEIHPVYGMAINIKDMGNSDGSKETEWAIFARYFGNEGWCSSQIHEYDSRIYTNWNTRTYTIFIPKPDGFGPIGDVTAVSDNFREIGGVSWGWVKYSEGILVQFNFPDPIIGVVYPIIHGELRLRWIPKQSPQAKDDQQKKENAGNKTISTDYRLERPAPLLQFAGLGNDLAIEHLRLAQLQRAPSVPQPPVSTLIPAPQVVMKKMNLERTLSSRLKKMTPEQKEIYRKNMALAKQPVQMHTNIPRRVPVKFPTSKSQTAPPVAGTSTAIQEYSKFASSTRRMPDQAGIKRNEQKVKALCAAFGGNVPDIPDFCKNVGGRVK